MEKGNKEKLFVNVLVHIYWNFNSSLKQIRFKTLDLNLASPAGSLQTLFVAAFLLA